MELEIAARTSNLIGLNATQPSVAERPRSREAFGRLYRTHYRAITGYIFRRVGDSSLADDLVADVFLAALQAWPRYRDRGVPVEAWLFRIATNRVNRWARRERKRVLAQLDSEPADREAASNPVTRARDHARAALLMLPPKYQAVLALHYLEGMPIERVAQAIGCRVGTVKSRLARGRERLRERLEHRRSQR